MPRTGRGGNNGGKRGGDPQGRLPMSAAQGGTYGSGVQQIRAQQVVPMANPIPAAPAPGAGPVTATPGPAPGSLGPLDAPTERPGQPVTAGVPIGAGPGSEVLGLRDERDVNLSDVAAYLPGLEIMANQPNTTIATRNMIRRLRGSLPPQVPAMDI